MDIINIMYRDVNDLALNYKKVENRVIYYQDNIFDNIYFTDKEGKYLGFYNAKLDKLQEQMDTQLFFDNSSDTKLIKNFFFTNPGIYRVPVIIDHVLVGEYYNNSTIGRSLFKQIEDTALSLVPIFQDYLKDWSSDKLIKLLGTEKNILLLDRSKFEFLM